MRVQNEVRVTAEANSVSPMVLCQFTVHFAYGNELLPQNLFGYLKAEDGKVLTTLQMVRAEEFHEIKLDIATGDERYKRKDEFQRSIWLAGELNERHLDYIETLRSKRPRGDVIFQFDLTARFFATKVQAPDERQPQSRAEQAQWAERFHSEFQPVLFRRDGYLLAETIQKVQTTATIPGSNWTHDFAPVWGLGQFAVFEIPVPELVSKDATLRERLQAAFDGASKARRNLRDGDWPQVCEDVRDVWELVKGQSAISDLLKSDGFNDDAIKNFESATGALFQLASKFAHRLDKSGKKINPEIKAQKEDAYFVFSLAMSILNIITRKGARLS